MDQWRIWLGRVFALAALLCGIFGLIIGVTGDFTWKLGMHGWFAGGTVAALVAVVMYLDDAAEARRK